MRTGEEAIAWGRSQIGSDDWNRLCLKFVRSCFGIPPLYPNAGDAWDHATKRVGTTNPMECPRGAPVWFETPGVADHIVLGLGNGLCLTNDWAGPGIISVARIGDISRTWGTLLGWSKDLNGRTVYDPTVPKEDPMSEEKKIADLYNSIENAWVDHRRVDRKQLSALQQTGSARFAKKADVAGDSIDAAMRAFLKG